MLAKKSNKNTDSIIILDVKSSAYDYISAIQNLLKIKFSFFYESKEPGFLEELMHEESFLVGYKDKIITIDNGKYDFDAVSVVIVIGKLLEENYTLFFVEGCQDGYKLAFMYLTNKQLKAQRKTIPNFDKEFIVAEKFVW